MTSLSDATAMSLFSRLQVHQYKSILVTSYQKVQSDKKAAQEEVRKEMQDYLEACAKDRKKKDKKLQKKLIKKLKKSDSVEKKHDPLSHYFEKDESSDVVSLTSEVLAKEPKSEVPVDTSSSSSNMVSHFDIIPRFDAAKNHHHHHHTEHKKSADLSGKKRHHCEVEQAENCKHSSHGNEPKTERKSELQSGSKSESSKHEVKAVPVVEKESTVTPAISFDKMSTHQLLGTVMELELREKALKGLMMRMQNSSTNKAVSEPSGKKHKPVV